ncbi:MAG: hypothetical protein V8S89_05570 [Oscillospiraceae bacterium]
MAQIKVIFWDIDGTLLNFEVAEESAIRKGFAAFGLGPQRRDARGVFHHQPHLLAAA